MNTNDGIKVTTFIIVVLLVLLVGGMIGCPRYHVWQKGLKGKAALKEAEWNRQIKVQEAKAEFDAAMFKKQADSLRAVGTAIANEIIAKSLTPEYIQWKWVEGLQDGSSEVIYIPTEANLPILEAMRKSKFFNIPEK